MVGFLVINIFELLTAEHYSSRIEMQKLPASGRVRNIGVSNFGIKHLEAIQAQPGFNIMPAVNQIEVSSTIQAM